MLCFLLVSSVTFNFGIFLQCKYPASDFSSSVIYLWCAGFGNDPGLCLLQSRTQQGLWEIHPLLFCQGEVVSHFMLLLLLFRLSLSLMLTLFGPPGGLHPGCSHGHLKEVERWTVNQVSIRPDRLSTISFFFPSSVKASNFLCFCVYISQDRHKTPPDYKVYHQTYCKYKYKKTRPFQALTIR